ncbi:MAG: hypothetical protein GOMPHAMPRED_006578 [Gomphillus americanus]|uniref:Uncharacterized protein n=1 Tax=Gomphillus americanus TaxID=1940652 RepID=A0A8H3FXD2_9LECA|nr:MAG: hypothetical protein GOMPHAMPRED_006578 [Gomphillus americanus]
MSFLQTVKTLHCRIPKGGMRVTGYGSFLDELLDPDPAQACPLLYEVFPQELDKQSTMVFLNQRVQPEFYLAQECIIEIDLNGRTLARCTVRTLADQRAAELSYEDTK